MTEGVRDFSYVDHEAFRRDVDALRKEIEPQLGADDMRHARKLALWGRLCSLLGYGTAWVFPNPLSAFLISTGSVARWTIFMHHVGHHGFDKVKGAPRHWTSRGFAQGWRRYVDFLDWMLPEGWVQEHNVLHHYHTGDMGDPDLVERDTEWLRDMKAPRWAKYAMVALYALFWKPFYYVPRVMRAVHYARARRADLIGPSVASTGGRATCEYPYDTRQLAPRRGTFSWFNPRGRETWLRCLLPYIAVRFVLIPAAFLLISPWAAFSVLVTSVMAEALANLHSFLVIAPNHTGDDVYRFDTPMTDKADWMVRQVVGSVNFNTGGDLRDFMQGFLNYQIEHHVWPDLPPLRYQQLQPRLKALCAKHGIPYVQEPIGKRVGQLLAIITGETTMPRGQTVPRDRRRSSPDVPSESVAVAAGSSSPSAEALSA